MIKRVPVIVTATIMIGIIRRGRGVGVENGGGGGVGVQEETMMGTKDFTNMNWVVAKEGWKGAGAIVLIEKKHKETDVLLEEIIIGKTTHIPGRKGLV